MKKPNFINVIIFIIKCTFVGFGGGNALMPIIKKYAVYNYKWIDETEFEKIIILTNLLPGPSVVESLSYIAIKLLGKFLGTIATLLGILPSLFLALGLYIGSNFLPKQYIFAINTGVISTIIGLVIAFGFNYIKLSNKILSLPVWITMFIATLIYIIFVPIPFNIASMPIIFLILVIFIHQIWNNRKKK